MTRLHNAYLTGRQLDIWTFMREGLSQSEIARKLDLSRQRVNQLVQTIPTRITEALLDAAKLNQIEPRTLDAARGMLLGFSEEFQTEVVITVHPETGVRVWYQHNLGRCKICSNKKTCKSMLLKNVEALGISLSADEKALDPSKLASLAFSRAFGVTNLHVEKRQGDQFQPRTPKTQMGVSVNLRASSA